MLTLETSFECSLWDSDFWSKMVAAERDACLAIESLWEESMTEGACSCSTCIVRTAMEVIWPTLTEQLIKVSEAASV